MAFSLNERTKELFRLWITEQLKHGVPFDDQRPLHFALASMHATHGKDFRLGYFETSFAASFLYHDTVHFKTWLPALTRSLSTFVPIVHPFMVEDGPTLKKICAIINKDPAKLRIAVIDRAEDLHSVQSPGKCDALLNMSCAGPMNDDGQLLHCSTEYQADGSKVVWRPPQPGQFIRPAH